jgi:mannose-1-phosphate guanylyltransferase
VINIILCGGSGTRLWPISRKLYPKQFFKIKNDKSFFQYTYLRNKELCDDFMIVTNEDHYFIAHDQLNEIVKSGLKVKYLIEPIGRNTSAAIALSCMKLDEDEIVLVSPADHVIKKNDEYKKVIKKGEKLASEGYIVTFGIKPDKAHTGYGYIQTDGGENVISFKEKPDLKTAQDYLKSGNYLWNSGMFMFKAGVFLKELKKYAEDIFKACENAAKNFEIFYYSEEKNKAEITRIKYDDMLNIPAMSVDYAVMEKSDKIKVIKSDIGWSDVGNFDSLYDFLDKDKHGNTEGENLINIDSKKNMILSVSNRKIACIGVKNMIVIDTPDALMITKRGMSERIKEVVDILKKEGSDLGNIHLTVHRPWGTYTILEEDDRYKIKRIVVKPGKRLSLQKHFHRSEHWVVVSGTAIVYCNGEEKLVRTNESVYIPIGDTHRLENPGKVDLILIEAQVGQYLGEDDIVRFEDDYKRS